MTTVVQTTNLCKTYGKNRGIDDLNLQVLQGEVFGYLGPNGAGKTTTIRTILDFIRPTSGNAQIFGLDSQRDSLAIHQKISYLPGELVMYEKMTGSEMLNYFAQLRGNVSQQAIKQLAERLELDLKRPIRTLSKGNKQKVGLVQAFMGQPELLILDEPTSGLDPLVQQTFYQLVLEAKNAGRTVFLSSHVMSEVEHICDRVGIIRAGKLLAIDTVKALKARARRTLDLYFAQPVEPSAFAHIPNIDDLQVLGNHVHCAVTGSIDQLIKTAAQFELRDLVSQATDLEDIFLAYYKGEVSDVA
ncbi:ATP-binding cassette domain-containing protein [Herpetosiphon sp. NSE202]|uniref:ATP-binding cassette domain-containing protein n=1 Tax=Herpetosiphon sp. NSE202 TaxID=3351349 RepID=UPI00363DE55E